MDTTNIRVFDADLNFIGEVSNFRSAIYTRRWENIGEFEIHLNVPRSDLFQNGFYVMFNNDPYLTGVIEHEFNNGDAYMPDATKDFTVSGYSLLGLLNRRCTVPPSGGDGYRHWTSVAPETIMYDLVKENCVSPTDTKRAIEHLICGTDQGRGTVTTFETRYKNLTEELNTLAVQSELGVAVKLDAENQRFVFEVLAGTDRRYSSDNPNSFIFSKKFGRVVSQTYEHSTRGTSNMAYVLGEGDGADRKLVTVNDTYQGLARRELYVDARDIANENEEEENYNVDESLKARGEEKLAEVSESLSFEFEADTREYRTLWNLGDKCTFRADEEGVTQENIIVEVVETWENNTHTIAPTAGHSSSTILGAIQSAATSATVERTGISAQFGEITAEFASINVLVANKVDTVTLTAYQAQIDEALITKATVEDLTAATARIGTLEVDNLNIKGRLDINEANITNLTADKANVTDLNATNANVENLNANKANVTDLTAATSRITDLESTRVTTDYLTANYITANQIAANYITAATVEATYATITTLEADYATILSLNAAVARIDTLDADTATIKTLVNGNLSSANIQAGGISSDRLTIADGFITNAMIASLAAGKITSGEINTSLVGIKGTNGNLAIADNTIQITDGTNTRVQIGKDANNDYSLYVWDASGNLMFDATGLHASGIKSGIIRNDMVAGDAAIAGSKLDIESVVTAVNGATTQINGTKVKLDSENQTLDVAFTSLKSTVTDVASETDSNTTAIGVEQGRIDTLITNTTITKDGTTTQLRDAYSQTVQTVDGLSTTVANQQTTLNTATGNITSVQNDVASLTQDIDGFKTTVYDTYATKTALSTTDGKFANYTTTTDMTSAITQKANEILSTVSSTYVTNSTLTTNYSTTTQTAGSISTAVSSKVGKSEIISSINQTAESITINASKINLTGAVTISALESSLASTVSTSSSNASAALTNAATAQATADGIEVGGRNLLRNSGVPVTGSAYNLVNYPISVGYAGLVVGEQYTITVWGAIGSDRVRISPYFSGGYMLACSFLQSDFVNGKASKTFTYKGQASGHENNDLSIFQMPSSGTTSSTITKIKMEKGNRATDWTPAPEDTTAAISAVDSTYAAWCYNNNKTYIDGGKIYTGTVTANKISASTLSAITANLGTVTAGVLQSANYVAGQSGSLFNLNTGACDISGSLHTSSDYGVSMLISGYAVDFFADGGTYSRIVKIPNNDGLIIESRNEARDENMRILQGDSQTEINYSNGNEQTPVFQIDIDRSNAGNNSLNVYIAPSKFMIDSKSFLNRTYPVGAIYMSVSSTSPATLFGGTWTALQNSFLVGAGSSYSVNGTGGSTTHNHTQTLAFSDAYTNANGLAYTNGGTVPSNAHYTGNASTLPPYLAVYMWKRTA